jgi:hypothetical protein
MDNNQVNYSRLNTSINLISNIIIMTITGVAILIIYQYIMNNNRPVIIAPQPILEKQTQEEKSQEEIRNKLVEETNIKNLEDVQNIIVDINNSDKHPLNIIREFDYKTVNDPLYPPRKRDEYNILYPSIATRGGPTSFKKYGILIDKDAENTDPYKFMTLMGRQKYPGSNFYDYYVIENKHDAVLKFDLDDLHKELYTDDTVVVEQLNKTYDVQIDKTLEYSYNPYSY